MRYMKVNNEHDESLRNGDRERPFLIRMLSSKGKKKVDCRIATPRLDIQTSSGKFIEEFYDGVHNGPVLGKGKTATVRLCTHRATGEKYAVKCFDRRYIQNKEGLQQIRNEISIMCQLSDHPNVVQLKEVYQNEKQKEIYLVQEFLGIDLFDQFNKQQSVFSEAQCANLVKQMLSALRYLHSKGIIHRDLKLENFLLTRNNSSPFLGREQQQLKLIDFGVSKHFHHAGQVQHEQVGTPYTVAPEIIRGSYDEKCDIWAIGVITYVLLCDEAPFGGIDGEKLHLVKENILRGEVSFEPKHIWANISDSGKAFVKSLLNPDPKKRPTAMGASRHSWIQRFGK